MTATSGASASLLSAAVVVPLFVFTLGLTLQVGRVVDARHWPLALGGAVVALVGFGLGSYLALAPRRYGWTALVTAGVLSVSSVAAGAAALLLPLFIIIALALLMAGAFKPDRSLPPTAPLLLAPTAGVAAICLYFILFSGSGLAWQLGLAAVDRNPETSVPPAGGVVEAWRAKSENLIASALATVPNTDIRPTLSRATSVKRLPIAFVEMPTQNELTNTGPIKFTDPHGGIEWTYSHDLGAFRGLRIADRHPVGALSPADGFQVPPLLIGDATMIAGGSLYRFDPASGTIERRLRLPPGETIVAKPSAIGNTLAILSDRNLYFVDRRVLENAPASGVTVAIPLPAPVGELYRLDLAQLPDRALVSFVVGRDAIEGPSSAWQRLVSVAPDGAVHILAQRPLDPNYPVALRFRAFWLSPALHALTVGATEVGGGSAWTPPRAPVDVPHTIWIAAALLSLTAAVASALIATRRRLGMRETTAWTLAAFAFGLPMFLAFCLLSPKPRLTN